MRNYSADQIELSFLGNDLKPGLADGSFLVDTPEGTGFTNTPRGAVDKVTSVYNVSKRGNVQIQVAQDSTEHQILLAIFKADRAQRDQVGGLEMTDNSSGMKITWLNARVMMRPGENRGTELAIYTWQFNYESYNEQIVVNNTQNLVGT